ncbi:ABC transporter substrate-binding protein [Agrobacterium sp. SHOUNA12C]|uniref:ABC transporter substrate-binding protein n=1 Tax=Rhizobium rhizogenes NBRC 13257 TaxID=1220581 RepID=A0AA87U948_RHIRH|nr:ABC transporter substrate-binding protein [Rhizobium rhizogenes]MCJ9720567.1 ABC transporter substrate-binding protein [Agrobacterium sp. BETTINA12B]MCJ9758538.1 ABC transporter substrate-binding protein [Agrobacterium sp. SHOUNA12C]NTF51441.1 ABC transporter substrate-binding protein [Rhizobium rhizogenes]NTF57975.1 ABC transporter substrate-binding protein [Rhizobium rhizogenes]NTF64394.1 ABC transporter substrate-binding protein [Rhizobium rhizogenes]
MLKLNRRHFLAGTAALLTAPSLGLAQTATPAKGGTLRISVDQAASVIHPLLTRVNPEYMVTELLYSNLTRLKVDMTIEPDLAESWSANDALTEWTFKLRAGVKFHDGSPFTATDVVETFKAILNPNNASPARNNVGPIADVTAADPLTAVFKLSDPYADFPVAMAYTVARIIPASIATGDFKKLSTTANGTGPFKLVSYEPDRLIVVERNPDYYDPKRPYLDRVEIQVFPDTSAQTSALLAGDIDVVSTVQPTEYLRMKDAQGVNALRIPSGQFCNINFGCDTKPFNDPRVRRALALTVDRQAMVDFVTEGFGTPGNDTPLNSSYHFYSDLPLRQANIEEAKELLTEAGYPDGFEATLIASDKPSQRTQLAVALREMAKEAGIRINVQTMPHATYLDQVWKKGSFYVGFYNMQPTADAIFKLLYTSDAAWNETRWNNAAFDKVVNEARGITDEAKRKALYAEAQKLMNEEVPSIIPVFFDVLAAKRDWVSGFEVHPRASVFRLDYTALTDKAPKRS